jgi:flavin-dependent dehydrogenase
VIDALVVGAGPAGALAALVLASRGVRVRLLDRATFPRPKLCGDTINPGALALLDGIGAGVAVRGLPCSVGARIRARALPVTGMAVSGEGGVHVVADYPDGVCGAAISRSELDQILVEAAVAAGAVFEDGARVLEPVTSGARVSGVRLATSAGPAVLPARVVVAADGRGSRLAAALRLSSFARRPRRWAFGTYFSDVAGMGPRGEVHIRKDGYIGVAPLPAGVANVCVVRDFTLRPSGRLDPEAIVRNAIGGDPALRVRFAVSRQRAPVVTLGPLAVQAVAAGVPGLLLAGDAAGFIDPMTGDGLRFAFRGGVLAAEAALAELASGVPAFDRLASARSREFSGKWRLNRTLRTLAGSPSGVTMASALSALWDYPVRRLVHLAADLDLLPASA